MIRLARLGAGMRWAITRNALRRRGLVVFVLTLLGAGLGALIGFGTLAAAQVAEADDRRVILTLTCTIIAIAWMFGPLLIGGADETVDPSRLALLPLSGRQLAAVLTGAAVSSPVTIALGIALLGGVVAGWAGPWGGLFGGLVSLLAMLALFVFGLGAARSVAALMGLANRTRRGRDLAVLIAALAGVTLWIGSQLIGPLVQSSGTRRGARIVDAMAWSPPGWAARAVLHARAGHPLAGLWWVLALVPVGAVLVWCWARLTGRLLVGSERHQARRAVGTGVVWPRATNANGAALAKAWRYQWRSPMKRTQTLITVVMSAGFALLQVLQLAGDEPAPKAVFVGLIALVFCADNAFNVVGFDSPSLWLEVTAGGGFGHNQLRARLLAYSFNVALAAVAAIFAVAIVGGVWAEVPLALAVVPGAVLCLLGIGAFLSAVAPLPQADGDNPFKRPAGSNGCIYGISIIAALVCVSIALAPVLVPVLAGDGRWRYGVAAAGTLWGWGLWRLGLHLADAVLARRGPDLLAELADRAAL